MSLTPEQYRDEVEKFRHLVGDGPLNNTLRTTALSIQEARAALMRAGTGDMAFDRQMFDLQKRLEQEAHE